MVSLCRLCASLRRSESMVFINAKSHNVCVKLEKYCRLIIDPNDNLPKGICPDCIHSLNAFHEFYERAHESQQSLTSLIISNASSNGNSINLFERTNDEQWSLNLLANNHSHGTGSAQYKYDGIDVELKEEDNGKDQQTTYLVVHSDTNDSVQSVKELSSRITIEQESVEKAVNDTELESIDEDYADNIERESIVKFEIVEDYEESQNEPSKDLIEATINFDSPIRDETNEISVSENSSFSVSWSNYHWQCVPCKDVFTTATQLIEHNENVHLIDVTNIEWLCIDCQKICPRYHTLINHIRKRHRQELLKLCDVCNAKCRTFEELDYHRQEYHVNGDIPFLMLCTTCGKGFNSRGGLQIHNQSHLPDEQRLRYTCNICDKKFRTTSNLKFHQKVHTGTRDYVCEHCGKNFIQRANLEDHMITHNNSTPFECSICSKLFKTSERLANHKLRHTDIKPFKCTECGKTFRTKDAMTTHMRIHTGEMPYSCEFCQKPFRFRSTLMTHHNVHTNTRPYCCVDCDHHFTNWPNYSKHMRRRHGINVSSRNPRGKKPTASPDLPMSPHKLDDLSKIYNLETDTEEDELNRDMKDEIAADNKCIENSPSDVIQGHLETVPSIA